MRKGRSAPESSRGIHLCGNRCVICGWSVLDSAGKSLVEGAHVREFSSGSEFDVAQNIIALCPNHHREYDSHLFYIDPATRILHSARPGWEFEGTDISKKIKHVEPRFLGYAKFQYDQYWESPNRNRKG